MAQSDKPWNTSDILSADRDWLREALAPAPALEVPPHLSQTPAPSSLHGQAVEQAAVPDARL